MLIRIAGITEDSIVEGPGLRLTVFVQGCKRNCKGCHNPQTHDPNGGKGIDTNRIIDMMYKNVTVNEDRSLMGHFNYPLAIAKGSVV